MPEDWKPVKGYQGFYEISSYGRVQSLVRITAAGRRGGGIITPYENSTGYLLVHLSKNGKTKKFILHSLVLEAFVCNRPDGMEARHWPSNDRKNCRLDNLQWSSHATNMADRKEHGTNIQGSRHPLAKLTESDVLFIRKIHASGAVCSRIAGHYSVCASTIEKIVNRKIWKHV